MREAGLGGRYCKRTIKIEGLLALRGRGGEVVGTMRVEMISMRSETSGSINRAV